MGAGALIGALIGLGASAIPALAGATIFGFSAGMFWLVGASIGSMFDQPEMPTVDTASPNDSFGPLRNTETQLIPVPVVYGQRRVGGNIFYHKYLNPDRSKMDMFVSMSEGPIASISNMMASDQEIENLITSTFTPYMGTFPQEVDALSPVDKQLGYPGTAYVACHLEANSKLKGNPVISAIVEGRKPWLPEGSPIVAGGESGLLGTYYKVDQGYYSDTGYWWRKKSSKFLERKRSTVNLSTYELSNTPYYVEYTGYIQVGTTGNYKFRFATSSNIQEIYIDGNKITAGENVYLVLDTLYTLRISTWLGWGSGNSNVLTGTTRTLIGGEDPYYIYLPDYASSGTLQKFYWTPPGGSEEIVPESVLFRSFGEYSNNPIWCLLDFLRNKRYGLAIGDEYFDIDFDNPNGESSWEKAASYCDEIMEDGNPRFTLNTILDEEKPFIDHIQEMLTTCRGYLICRDQITVHIEKYETMYQKLLDINNIVEGSFGFFIKQQDEIPNRIEVEWIDPSTEDTGGHWDRVIAVAQNDERILNEGPRIRKVPLLGVTDHRQAKNMAEYMLGQAEHALLYMTFSLGLQDSDVEVGEVVKTDHPMLDKPRWARILKIEDGQNENINVLAVDYYIPEFSIEKSWEKNSLVRFEGHIYKSIKYVPTSVEWSAMSYAVSGGDQVDHTKDLAFDMREPGYLYPPEGSAWYSSQTGTAVSGNAYIGQIFPVIRPVQYINIRGYIPMSQGMPSSIKVQKYNRETETWADVETFSIPIGGTELLLTEKDHFYGLRILANANLPVDIPFAVKDLKMMESYDFVAPANEYGTVNTDYWEFVE